MEYDSFVKKNEILPSGTTWVNLEGIVLSEISQTEKDKCCMISLICGVKKQSNRQNCNKLINTGHFDSHHMGVRLWGWVKKVKKSRNTNR